MPRLALADKDVRHVATQAGVEKYKQPLHSIIRPDLPGPVHKRLPGLDAVIGQRNAKTSPAAKELARSVAALLTEALPDDLTVRDINAKEWPPGTGNVRVRIKAYSPHDEFNPAVDVVRDFTKTPDGLEVHHHLLEITPDYQSMGIATRFNRAMEAQYRAQGVKRITLEADIDVGGYAWARAGYDWDRSKVTETNLRFLLDSYRRVATSRWPDHPEYTERIDGWLADLGRGEWPLPFDLAMLGWEPGRYTWFGKEHMLGTRWHGEKRL